MSNKQISATKSVRKDCPPASPDTFRDTHTHKQTYIHTNTHVLKMLALASPVWQKSQISGVNIVTVCVFVCVWCVFRGHSSLNAICWSALVVCGRLGIEKSAITFRTAAFFIYDGHLPIYLSVRLCVCCVLIEKLATCKNDTFCASAKFSHFLLDVVRREREKYFNPFINLSSC